jgi:hypothetical protein
MLRVCQKQADAGSSVTDASNFEDAPPARLLQATKSIEIRRPGFDPTNYGSNKETRTYWIRADCVPKSRESEKMIMQELKNAWQIIKEHSRAYVALNVIYYGLILGAMFFVAFNPSLQQSLMAHVREAFAKGSFRPVWFAYAHKHVLLAMVLTFLVNFVFGSLATITLPSMIVPFSGLAMGILRATLWGLLFSPTESGIGLGMIPHSLTVVLEGQAYVVAMFAAYLHGRSFVQPRSVGAATCGEGYVAGLKMSLHLYSLVILLLFVSAVYEAIEVIHIAPLLTGKS